MGLFKDCGCGCNGKKQEEKFIISIISGLTFFIVANPETFRLVRRVLGPRIATPTGCPSTMGLLVHTLVFILVVWGMMNIKKERKEKKGCGCGEKKVAVRVRRLSSSLLCPWLTPPNPNQVSPNLRLNSSIVAAISHPCPSTRMVSCFKTLRRNQFRLRCRPFFHSPLPVFRKSLSCHRGICFP